MKQPPKKYQPPVVKSEPACGPAVLLVCTRQYNCVAECGFTCCQPTSTTCFGGCC